MSEDMKEQLIATIKKSRAFSIQLDELTDVGNETQLMVCIRYPGVKVLKRTFYFADHFPPQQLEKTFLKW
jgi:hypothetical protein